MTVDGLDVLCLFRYVLESYVLFGFFGDFVTVCGVVGSGLYMCDVRCMSVCGVSFILYEVIR